MAETLSQVAMRILPVELKGLSPGRLAEIEKAIAEQSAEIIAQARSSVRLQGSNDPEHAKARALKMALDLRSKLARAA